MKTIDMTNITAATQQAVFSLAEKIKPEMASWKMTEMRIAFSPSISGDGIRYTIDVYNESGDPDTLATGEWKPKNATA